jgi:hypothetical protein
LAWVQQTNALVKNSASNINVLDQWPGRLPSGIGDRQEVGERKVPSKISYSVTQNGERQWGFSIDSTSTVLEWTKMELMPHSPGTQLVVLRNLLGGLSMLRSFQERGDLENEIPQHLILSTTDIIEDYLYKIAVEWYHQMVLQGAVMLEDIDLDIVVTHPTVRYSPFLCIFRSSS